MKKLEQQLSNVIFQNFRPEAGWDETNVFGRDRDREIRLMKIHYETKTEKKVDADFLNKTRRDCLIFYVRDETETRLNSKFRARPRRDRESRCLFFRD